VAFRSPTSAINASKTYHWNPSLQWFIEFELLSILCL
jgi:hypothetical protein